LARHRARDDAFAGGRDSKADLHDPAVSTTWEAMISLLWTGQSIRSSQFWISPS
jgi:hypothetical protein